jgi:serine protease Do
MRRSLASLGIVTLGVLSMAIRPHEPPPTPPPAPTAPPPAPTPAKPPPPPVPTAKKVVGTPPAAPPPAATAPTPPASTPALPTPPAPNTVEKARQGVVVIERQGRPLALGMVLEGDGRILTALSPLANGNFLSARYADGAVAQLKLVLGDRGWDLALLAAAPAVAPPSKAPAPAPAQPTTTRKAGLRAARAPSFVGLQGFNLAPPATVAAAPAALKLSAGMLGGDATSLAGAYELASKPAFVGAPIVNPEGEVVALVARACPVAAGATCTPAPYAAPVTALKQFLQRVPAEATWLGVEAAADEAQGVHGVRIVSVTPNSPAAIAGVRPGANALEADLVVAVDGSPVATPAALNEAVRAHTMGDSVELLLYGLGRYRHVSVKPRPAPQLTAPPYVAPKPGRPRLPNPYR